MAPNTRLKIIQTGDGQNEFNRAISRKPAYSGLLMEKCMKSFRMFFSLALAAVMMTVGLARADTVTATFTNPVFCSKFDLAFNVAQSVIPEACTPMTLSATFVAAPASRVPLQLLGFSLDLFNVNYGLGDLTKFQGPDYVDLGLGAGEARILTPGSFDLWVTLLADNAFVTWRTPDQLEFQYHQNNTFTETETLRVANNLHQGVPLPGSLALAAIGLMGLSFKRKT
jgi:hypothetical protein